ncbi:MAG: adenylate/guanylate cyclase domain-containing protein [Burkholderiaceae bacterium]|nr:adenylate/guanylate cyclase domain-containing protein [Burkholderiaceae bacterium]
MANDEPGTVAALDCARAVFGEHIGAHQGRVIDMAGDSVLAVFDTAAGAVSAALAVQDEIATRAAAHTEPCRMRFRIGVHLGDVIEKADGSVYGDGVNTAARLETLAEPGGVCVSEAVECALRHRLQVRFDDLGEQTLKNLPQPVRAFRVHAAAQAAPGAAQASAPRGATAGGADSRTLKPAIAVLPFDNMSGEAEQEFFTDGITEDIITELSRFRELFVISRNSSFKYKGQKVDVAKFARELGVQYVVEGSVRKAGKRVRITVQLIDAETDRHVWAERYDRDLEDIFAIQDEVTTAIVATLPGRVEADARDRAARKPTANMAAYECVLTGKLLHHRSNRADNLRAQEMLERAIALDPNYAHAHAWRACVLGQRWGYNWCEDRSVLQPMVIEELEIALALDPNDSDVHRIFAAVNLIYGNFEQCVYHQQRALALNPNDDLIVVQQGEILTWCGQPQEGIEWIRKAMRLNPYHPERFWGHLARASFVAGAYGEALAAARRITTPDATLFALIAACEVRRGDVEAARRCIAEMRARWPAFGLADLVATLHYRDTADRDRHLETLAQAGLRE